MLSRIHEKIIISKQKENIRKGLFLETKANFMVETDWEGSIAKNAGPPVVGFAKSAKNSKLRVLCDNSV